MEIFFISLVALVFGSFASCISHRMAIGESWVFVRSKCLKCNKILSVKNLIPLFSWIFQKGKCHNCKEKISWRYPLIELLFLGSFLAIFFINHQIINAKFIFICLIATILIIMSIIDIEKYFIPDIMQTALLIVVVALVYFDDGFATIHLNILAGVAFMSFLMALYFLFYIAIKRAAIGNDDIKIMFTIGFAIGFSKFLSFIFLTGIFGIIFGSIWIKLKKDDAFPFAPALSLSFLTCLLIDKNFSFEKIIDLIIF